MPAYFDADGDYASLTGLTDGQLSNVGFNNFFAAGWYRRNLAESTHGNIASGSIVHFESAAREHQLGFNSAGANPQDPVFITQGDGFAITFAATEQPPFDRWIWVGTTDHGDRCFTFWSPLGSDVFHVGSIANAHAGSQFVQTLRIGGNTGNVAAGYYAYWRARKGGIIDLQTLRRLKRSWRAESRDFAFYPFEYDARDYGPRRNNLTVTGSVQYRNDAGLMAYLRAASSSPIPFLNIAGGLSGAVGTATETDTALGLAKFKTKALGLATETDTSLALTRVKVRATGIATETDSALGLAKFKSKALGLANETDSSLALTRLKIRALGLSAETDTALTLARAMGRTVGVATETDTALNLARLKIKGLGRSDETDTALALSSAAGIAVGRADETDTALSLSRLKIRACGTALETDAALALTRVKAKACATATETAAAFALARLKLRATGRADETDTALELAGGATPPATDTEWIIRARRRARR